MEELSGLVLINAVEPLCQAPIEVYPFQLQVSSQKESEKQEASKESKEAPKESEKQEVPKETEKQEVPKESEAPKELQKEPQEEGREPIEPTETSGIVVQQFLEEEFVDASGSSVVFQQIFEVSQLGEIPQQRATSTIPSQQQMQERKPKVVVFGGTGD